MARSKSDKTGEGSSTSAFAKHAQQDDALRGTNDEATTTGDASSLSNGGLTMSGRIMVFIVFPVTCGVIGLYMGYLETLRKPDRKISFDQDFVMPFLLALAMAAVLFFQTGGFSTTQVKPIVAWPKARRVKKVIKKKKKGEADADKVDYASSSGDNKKED